MIRPALCKLCLSICLALSVGNVEAQESNILGRAFDQESGKFLYSEHHSCSNRIFTVLGRISRCSRRANCPQNT